MVPTMFDIQYACCMVLILVGMIVARIMNVEPSYNTVKSHDIKNTSDGRQSRNTKRPSRQNKRCKKAKQEKHNQADKEETEISKYMRDLTDNTCSKICMDIIRGLGLKFSDRYNAQWDIRDFYRYLVAICANSGEEGTAERQHEISVITNSMAQLPTRTWLFGKIKRIRYDHMLSRCTKMISRMVKRSRRHGLLRGSVDISIDMHDIPLYARVMKMILAYATKRKKGTTFVTRLITAHCVTNGHRMTLGVILVKRGDKIEDLVYKLLQMCKKNNIRINSVTMDRGFYTTRVVSMLQQEKVQFLMPAIKRKSIEEKLNAFSKGDIPAASPFTMTSDDKKTSTCTTLVITERPEKKQNMTTENQRLMDLYNKETKEYDRYIPFITNMKFPNIQDNPEQVAEFYKRRWGVEVSYKGYEQIRPWTTSTNHSVRILLLFFPFILYNAWVLANYVAKHKSGSGYASYNESAKYDRPTCPLGLFVDTLHDILNQRALESELYKGPPNRHTCSAVAA